MNYSCQPWCVSHKELYIIEKRRDPISLQERAYEETTYPKKRQICEPIVLAKTIDNKQLRRRKWNNKAMDCSRRRVLACIACTIDRCNAIDTLSFLNAHVQSSTLRVIDSTACRFNTIESIRIFKSKAIHVSWHLRHRLCLVCILHLPYSGNNGHCTVIMFFGVWQSGKRAKFQPLGWNCAREVYFNR